MFIEIDELKSAMYGYQLSEITETDNDIATMAIDAAVSEMKSYLNPSNQKRWNDGRPLYDVEKIFTATGADRDALILELCKNISVYYVVRLSNVDIIYEHVDKRYERAIDWLEKVAGVGKYANAPTLTPNLPTIEQVPGETERKPFRFGSRTKFNHNFNY